MNSRPRLVLAAVACLPLALAAPARAQTAPGLMMAPCELPEVQGPARCGTFEVWENRETKAGRKIRLNFAVIPARGPNRASDAVVPLAGGPGQAAVELAAGSAWQLEGVRDTRDILLVDQRGSGQSRQLDCVLYGPDLQSYFGAFYPADRVAACAAALADSADVTQYTSAPSADDLDELRAALGYETLNLVGTSYGTRAAQVYMRRHPRRVRSAVLIGTVPMDARMPLATAGDAERAVGGVIAECEAQPACRAAFPDLRASLRAVVERLARAPAEVTITHPETLEPATVRLPRDLFGEGLRYMLYSGGNALFVPAVIHHAARGELAPIAEFALNARRNVVDEGGDGLYMSVLCSEDVAFIDPAEGARRAEGTFLGDYRVRDQKAACARWPHRAVAPDFLQPVRSDAPTLLLSGQWDPATPPAQGEAVARTLSRSRHVVIPSGAHGYDALENGWECANRMIVAFIRAPEPAALDTGCVATVRRRPFPTGALAATPVSLSASALARFAGEYRGAGGQRITVRVDGGRLRARAGDGQELVLVPVGPARFKAASAPFLFVSFTTEAGAPRFLLEQGGRVTLAADRVNP